MRIVHLATEPIIHTPKRGKIANDKQALQVGLLAWKLKHNARLEKQNKLKTYNHD
jgi:hypothetical protein